MAPWRQLLHEGQVLPALPLALREDGTWSQEHQRALIRYYMAAGAGGLAVAVHSTQFAIREHGLLGPVLSLAATTMDESPDPLIRIAGVCGRTPQAADEARLAMDLGYHAALVSPGAFRDAPEAELLAHLRHIADILPVIGFYLQPAVGGRVLSYQFWRRFAEIPNIAAVKIAPFNRYQTGEVIRALRDSGRTDIALYTGNDDAILTDLLTAWPGGAFIAGGLLGQWGVWTRRAVEMLTEVKAVRRACVLPAAWLTRNAALTDANAAVFDAANNFHGCIPGILEVLRRQGLVPSNRCLDPLEHLSPGQADEITRAAAAYPWLTDDDFVQEGLSRWLQPGCQQSVGSIHSPAGCDRAVM